MVCAITGTPFRGRHYGDRHCGDCHYGDCHAAAALLLHLTADGQGRAAMLSCPVLCGTLDETAWVVHFCGIGRNENSIIQCNLETYPPVGSVPQRAAAAQACSVGLPRQLPC